MGYETIDNTLRQNEAQYQQSRKATGSTGFDLARGTGAVAGSILPVGKLARALNTTRIGKASPAIKSALVGGTADASIPVTDTNNFASEKLKQVVTGAVLGPAFDKVAGLVAPQIQSGAKKLMDMGVKVTPGQAFGGALKHVEQKVESLPLVGDLIRGGRGRGVEDFNRVVIDDSLSSLGIALPANVQSGRRAIEYAGQRISKSYNDVVEKLTSSVDEKFVNEISELAELSKNMVDSRAKQFSDILQNKLFRKVSPNGTITGESAKEIESELGTLARKFGNSPDADQQLMGDAIMQAQGIVKQLIRRSNPEAAAPLDAANAAYAKFLRVERAAGGLGAKQGETPGVFSPAQFRSSVRATDPSRNKRQFARGNALSQKLAETGEEVLGNVVPDFGTAGRGMMGAMLLGGGSGYFIDPAIAAASLAGSSIYTRPGISLVNRLLSRPSAVQVAGARARPYAPVWFQGKAAFKTNHKRHPV